MSLRRQPGRGPDSRPGCEGHWPSRGTLDALRSHGNQALPSKFGCCSAAGGAAHIRWCPDTPMQNIGTAFGNREGVKANAKFHKDFGKLAYAAVPRQCRHPGCSPPPPVAEMPLREQSPMPGWHAMARCRLAFPVLLLEPVCSVTRISTGPLALAKQRRLLEARVLRRNSVPSRKISCRAPRLLKPEHAPRIPLVNQGRVGWRGGRRTTSMLTAAPSAAAAQMSVRRQGYGSGRRTA